MVNGFSCNLELTQSSMYIRDKMHLKQRKLLDSVITHVLLLIPSLLSDFVLNSETTTR
jgi:hypothetical protein